MRVISHASARTPSAKLVDRLASTAFRFDSNDLSCFGVAGVEAFSGVMVIGSYLSYGLLAP
jgi:hypothetical protein